MSDRLLSKSELNCLAPAGLRQWRKQRYDGGGFEVELAAFAPADAIKIRAIYEAIHRLADLLVDLAQTNLFRPADVASLQARPELAEIFATARKIGVAQDLSAPLRATSMRATI
jgi:hypothetical protein